MKDIFKNIRTKLGRFFDTDKEKMEMDPEKDWAIIIFFFFLSALVLFLFYKYIFGVGNDIARAMNLSASSTPDMSTANLSEQRMEKILSPWVEKRKNFDELKNNRPSFDFLR